MRFGTAISIATLAVSTAALVLVLWLIVTKPWVEGESVPTTNSIIATEPTPAPFQHRQLLSWTQVENILEAYVLTDPEGLVANPPTIGEVDGCLYSQRTMAAYGTRINPSTGGLIPFVKPGEPPIVSITLYDKDVLTWGYLNDNSDRWIVTSVAVNCAGVKNLYIDDNTGEITYGHPDEK